ncbi:MAG TPA: OmpA family protein [Burkholderiales bacterium]|nr:OmpA family protein [Burkholderiales bacterium]
MTGLQLCKPDLLPRNQATPAGLLLCVLGFVLVGACAQQPPRNNDSIVSLVVLPKAPDGHVGAVMVRPLDGGKAVLVDKPYVEASLRDAKAVRTSSIDANSVNATFGKTLAALPAQPAVHVVYFVEGTDELNPSAQGVIDRVAADFAARPSPEIAVVGHTDFVGTDQYNDTLSLQRALRVRDLLVRRGIPTKVIQAAGRGKREPLIKTSEDVVEPRNRRVEIIVR